MAMIIRTNEAGNHIVRLAKVVAIRLAEDNEDEPATDNRWTIYFEGCVSIQTPDMELAGRVIDFLKNANASDERFFNRDG